jgi:hypothetical protein
MGRPAFILPDEAKVLIHQASDDEQRPQFTIGDLTMGLVDEFKDQVPIHTIRQAIAVEYRCGAATIRDREGVARRVPLDLRQEFEVLSFHQWKAIAAAPTLEDRKRIAAWAVRSADDFGGRPAPVDAIRHKMKNGHDQTPMWEKRWDKALELLEMLLTDDETDDKVRRFCRAALSTAKSRGIDFRG